jgi:hypothetical protein
LRRGNAKDEIAKAATLLEYYFGAKTFVTLSKACRGKKVSKQCKINSSPFRCDIYKKWNTYSKV